MTAKMPDFLILGAGKSGTTSLYFYLQQHPGISMPYNKEPAFFTFEGEDVNQYHYIGTRSSQALPVTSISEYQALFANLPAGDVVGEASTLYLFRENTPERILHYIPDVKMIAILRNPIERAFSHYSHFRRDGHEPISDFFSAIKAEPERMKEEWFPSYFYTEAGFYARQIKNYLKYFPLSQFRFYLYEDLKDSDTLMRSIFEFLGVNSDIDLDTTAKYNVSGRFGFPKLSQAIRNSSKFKPFLRSLIAPRHWNWLKNRWDAVSLLKNQPISEADRRYLVDLYREDIMELQVILQRDLSSWLQ